MRIAEAQSEATVGPRLMQNEIAARQGIVTFAKNGLFSSRFGWAFEPGCHGDEHLAMVSTRPRSRRRHKG
jgi:hypothetical protein